MINKKLCLNAVQSNKILLRLLTDQTITELANLSTALVW